MSVIDQAVWSYLSLLKKAKLIESGVKFLSRISQNQLHHINSAKILQDLSPSFFYPKSTQFEKKVANLVRFVRIH